MIRKIRMSKLANTVKSRYDFHVGDFNKDKAVIESNNDNGKKSLSLTIHDSYSVKVDY